jgi:hypothetical protein
MTLSIAAVIEALPKRKPVTTRNVASLHLSSLQWIHVTCFDLGCGFFGAESQSVRCLWPVTETFQFKTHCVQVQLGLVCAT